MKITAVEQLVRKHYAQLAGPVRAMLAVFAAMSLKGRSKPITLIFETPSGYGKSTTIQMAFPMEDGLLRQFVYRTDKFTDKAFVSHAANEKRQSLPNIDLLPKLKDKVLLTKELAPIFHGRDDELRDRFSVLISVLDGVGFTSDSGMMGQRGYEERIVFNWIGATTPLPASTHAMMSQLGTRMLFYEVPAVPPSVDDLFQYAKKDSGSTAELECQAVVNQFLLELFKRSPVGSVEQESIKISDALLSQIARWASFLAYARAEVKYEHGEDKKNKEAICASSPEAAYKIVGYFKDIARGSALLDERQEVNATDLQLVAEVALSSVPGHSRPILRFLRTESSVTSTQCQELCGVSKPTARKYLRELELLGLATITKGLPETNSADTAQLAPKYGWLHLESEVYVDTQVEQPQSKIGWVSEDTLLSR